jgi:hypothetical protein
MCSYKEKSGVWTNKCRSMSRSTPHLVMDSEAHIVRRAGKKINHNCAKTIAGENLLGGSIYILSLYPKFFGYSLGGYSHREH